MLRIEKEFDLRRDARLGVRHEHVHVLPGAHVSFVGRNPSFVPLDARFFFEDVIDSVETTYTLSSLKRSSHLINAKTAIVVAIKPLHLAATTKDLYANHNVFKRETIADVVSWGMGDEKTTFNVDWLTLNAKTLALALDREPDIWKVRLNTIFSDVFMNWWQITVNTYDALVLTAHGNLYTIPSVFLREFTVRL